MTQPLTAQQLDEIETRAAHLDEYATIVDGPLQSTVDLLIGTDVPALLAEVRRLTARQLTEGEYNAAWHAVEGAAGEEGADPGTILHAVLAKLGIELPAAASTDRRLHLVIDHPAPGEWYGRLDVTEALEAAGWESDETRTVLKRNGATWALLNESDDSGLDCPDGSVIEFPGSTPTVVIVAACLAAAAPTP